MSSQPGVSFQDSLASKDLSAMRFQTAPVWLVEFPAWIPTRSLQQGFLSQGTPRNYVWLARMPPKAMKRSAAKAKRVTEMGHSWRPSV